MKKIRIQFEQDAALDNIEVIIRAAARDDDVAALIGRISAEPPKSITVTEHDGTLIKITPQDIVSVSVCGKLVQIVTEKDRYTVRQPLQSFESRPEFQQFVRISRYEMINLDKVIKFDFTLGGTLRLELAGGMETWASRRNIPLIRKKLMERK